MDTEDFKKLALELNQSAGIYTLVQGVIEDKPHWFVAEIAPSRYPAFLEAQKLGGYSISSYAKRILAQGEGEPPPGIMEKIKAEHPEIHFGFEKDVADMMEPKPTGWQEKNK